MVAGCQEQGTQDQETVHRIHAVYVRLHEEQCQEVPMHYRRRLRRYNINNITSFLPRDAYAYRALCCDKMSVRLSVRLTSIIRRYSV